MRKRSYLFRIIPAIILLLAGSILPAPSRIAADAGSLPVVTTGNATGITATSAVFRGTLASLGSGNATSISFQWGTNSENYTHETSPVSIGFTGNFSASISTLSANTT